MSITPTCSIRILAQEIGEDKKNQVNNLKTFNILREGDFLRIESGFFPCPSEFGLLTKADDGFYGLIS